MATKKRIAARIAGALGPSFQARRGVVYRPGFSYFLNGVLIEGTPYKDTVYIWKLAAAFFSATTFLVLDYSRRIPNDAGSLGGYFEGTDEEVADKAVDVILGSALKEQLHADITPRDFLELNARINLNRPTT